MFETPDYSQPPEKPKQGMSRRAFLGRAAAAGAVVGSGYALWPEGETEPEVESIEPLATSERLLAEVSGYEAQIRLRSNEVLFVDEHNIPVGDPVVLEGFVGPLPPGVTVKEGQAPEYNYSLGELDQLGLPTGKIPPRWLTQKRTEQLAAHPTRTIDRQLNVVGDFQGAMAEADEPELVEAILNGHIETCDDIISYFADKPVRGAEHQTRREYAREMVVFRQEDEGERPAVPETVQAELAHHLPGLFAQESKFNAGLVSRTGARGLAQIQPETWEEYRGSRDVSLSMSEQMAVVGELMSDNYHYLTHYVDAENWQIAQELFPTQEDFERLLVVPLMINAYNAGGPLMGLAMRDYLRATPADSLPEPEELFLAIADYAQATDNETFDIYKDDAREYVPRVYGNSALLDKKYPEVG